MIAMALACRPKVLIADEPTTALDVTVQAEILELIKHLQDEHGMSVLFITHDMGVVAEIADRVLVMWRGDKVEEATDRGAVRAPARTLHARPARRCAAARLDARRAARRSSFRVVDPVDRRTSSQRRRCRSTARSPSGRCSRSQGLDHALRHPSGVLRAA